MSGPRCASLHSARKWLSARAAVLALSIAPRPASAQPATGPASAPPSVALAWSGPGPELTCLGEDGLARAVNDYIGRDAFASSSVEFVLRVVVERLEDRRWRALLELDDRSGSVLGARELTSTSDLCSSLNEPLVLAVALMVDAEPEAVTTPVRPPEPATPPPPEDDAPAAPAAARQRERIRVAVDAALALETGLLPAVRPGLALGLELRPASWLAARVGALGFLPATATLPAEAEVRFALFAGTLELCPVVALAELRAGLCVGALYGALSARSSGLGAGTDPTRPVLALSAALRATLAFGNHWAALASLGALAPVRPEPFVYDLDGVRQEAFQMPAVSALATAGVSFQF